MNAETLEAELTAAHERAHAAYARRDAAAYVSVFHPDGEYTQRDGRTIGRDRLARQIQTQLARVHRASTSYHRESLEMLGADRALEIAEQHASFEVRAFFILHREWTVRRRGRYEWIRSADGWQIRRAEVLSEKITSRTWLALR